MTEEEGRRDEDMEAGAPLLAGSQPKDSGGTATAALSSEPLEGGTGGRRQCGMCGTCGPPPPDQLKIDCQCPPKLSVGTRALFSRGKLAVPFFYFILGINLTLVYLALLVYMRKRLQSSPANQSLIKGVIMGLPWNFKIFYAFTSDAFPIRGYRRKPYMYIGITICAASWILLGITNPSTVGAASMLLFSAVFGLILSDVMADTLVVEWVHQYEMRRATTQDGDDRGDAKDEDLGRMQSACWMLRFAGNLVGNLVGGWLAGHQKPGLALEPRSIFVIQGVVHLTLLVPLYFLQDRNVLVDADGNPAAFRPGQSARAKLAKLWEAVQDRRIWGAVLFIYASNVTPSSGDAMDNFMLGPLAFDESMLGYLATIGSVGSLLGVMLYRGCLRGINLRILFSVTLVVACGLSLTQLILVFRVNKAWGIPDFWFAFGDEVINSVAQFVIQMPVLVLCATLCPPGVEGTLYAFLTVVNNVALSVSSNLSAVVTDAFGVTLKEFKNLWIVVTLCSLTMLLPIFFIMLIPANAKAGDNKSKKKSNNNSNKEGKGEDDGEEEDEEESSDTAALVGGGGGGPITRRASRVAGGVITAGGKPGEQPGRGPSRGSLVGGALCVTAVLGSLVFSVVQAIVKLNMKEEKKF